MMPSASRSLTDPIGLNASIFTYRLTCGGASLLIRTTGVLPMVPRMLSNLRPIVEPPPLSVEPASLRRLPFRPEIPPDRPEIRRLESRGHRERECRQSPPPARPSPDPGFS